MDINELSEPRGDAIDLEVGEKVDGIIEHIGEWREITGRFGSSTKLPLVLLVDGEPRTRWIKKGGREARVIGDAVRAAGATELLRGGRLQLARIADKPTDKGNPMHDFAAKYTPPSASSGVTASDLFGD